jgi:ABC-2 type transport system permease protein
MNPQTFPVLIRREFWEHRQLWIAPLVLAVAYIAVCFLPGAIHFGDGSDFPRNGSPSTGQFFFMGMQLFSTGLLYLLMSVVIFFYLTDSLYAERKDRSILFWKSLPVSDAATVLAKVAVAMLVVPVGVVLLSIVANLLAFGVVSVRLSDSPLQQFLQWNTGTWIRLNGLLLVDVLVLALWFLPFAGYQLLVSAWAKSNVFIWTILPPLALTFGERLVFGTWYIGKFLLSRLTVGMAGARPDAPLNAANAVEETLHRINATPQLATLELWLGVLAGALLVYGAIRIRRYRDDS